MNEQDQITLEPDGGNVYRPHKLQNDSGTFWRCAHGSTGFTDKGFIAGRLEFVGCSECAEADPVAYAAFYADQP